MLRRLRIMVALASPFPYREHLTPLLGGALAAAGLVGTAFAMPVELGAAELVLVVRFGYLIVAVGCAFLLNDGATALTTVVSVPRLVRYGARLLQGIGVVAAWWAFMIALIAWRTAGEWPAAWKVGLVVEGCASCTAVLAVAAAIFSRTGGRPGLAAALTLLVAVVGVWLAPGTSDILPFPGDTRWTAIHVWWGLGFIATGVVFVLTALETGSIRPGPIKRLSRVP